MINANVSRKTALTHNVELLKEVAIDAIQLKIMRAKQKGSTRIGWTGQLMEMSNMEVYFRTLLDVVIDLKDSGYSVKFEKSFFNQKAVDYLYISWE